MALATVDQVKQWLGMSGEKDDALLERLVNAASAAIETYLSRTILSASYTETRHGSGTDALMLRRGPVTAVSALTIDGISVPASTGPSVYGWVFDEYALYLRGGTFPRGRNNVVVSYTAGYAAVPADIVDACVQWTGMRYRERDRIGHASKQLAGEVVSFDLKDMPANVKTVLNQYRRVVPL